MLGMQSMIALQSMIANWKVFPRFIPRSGLKGSRLITHEDQCETPHVAESAADVPRVTLITSRSENYHCLRPT
jgi:hypothetical protein